jgi:TetR/AcrR family transcriptional regulator, transcriptional repressor for nem operon
MAKHQLEAGTAADILDIAERLAQTRGFNGFSYADVSSELGISKAALHYHFAGKVELGHRLIARYSERFRSALEAIEASAIPHSKKLAAYCDIYRQTLSSQRMCLCGMLAAEYKTLGEPMRVAICSFFDQNRTWLAALLESGREAGDLYFTEPAERAAKTIIAALEGALLIAGPLHDPAILDAVVERVLADFAPHHQRAPSLTGPTAM